MHIVLRSIVKYKITGVLNDQTERVLRNTLTRIEQFR